MDMIKEKILELLLGLYEVDRTKPPKEYEAVFELDWDPLSFVKEQKFTEIPAKAIAHAITLTGYANDAQAATTSEYLSQTWPAMGSHILQLVTSVLPHTEGYRSTSQLSDGTNLDARMNQGLFIVTTTGTIDSITEIGQILVWLGAALRSSPFESGVTTCTPHLKGGRSTGASCKFEATFEIRRPLNKEEGTSGRCWHYMFRNPVIVSGYPILAKPEHGLGLEMPLSMMAIMAGADRVDEFDGKIYIKGFSTMLIATRLVGDMMVWHYSYKSNGERISFYDHNIQDADEIYIQQVDTVRHVVGWCSEFKFNVGVRRQS